MSVLIVIPCSARKLSKPARARDLYTGPLFRSALRAAEQLAAQHRGTVAVLSARHGLVELDRVLEPYDVTFGQPDAIDAATLREHLAQHASSEIVALLPNRYDRLLTDALGTPAVNPLRGSRGIGEQRSILAEIASGELDPPIDPIASVIRAYLWGEHGIVSKRPLPAAYRSGIIRAVRGAAW